MGEVFQRSQKTKGKNKGGNCIQVQGRRLFPVGKTSPRRGETFIDTERNQITLFDSAAARRT